MENPKKDSKEITATETKKGSIKPNENKPTNTLNPQKENSKSLSSPNSNFGKNNFSKYFNANSENEIKVIKIKRITKVVKGGRRFSFSALVIAGNKKNNVGYGIGKANEVPDAIKKASKKAIKNFVTVKITANKSIPHEIICKHDAARVLLKPAPIGKGIIAGGPTRIILEMAGIKNVYGKILGSHTPINVVHATFKAINGLKWKKDINNILNYKVAPKKTNIDFKGAKNGTK